MPERYTATPAFTTKISPRSDNISPRRWRRCTIAIRQRSAAAPDGSPCCHDYTSQQTIAYTLAQRREFARAPLRYVIAQMTAGRPPYSMPRASTPAAALRASSSHTPRPARPAPRQDYAPNDHRYCRPAPRYDIRPPAHHEHLPISSRPIMFMHACALIFDACAARSVRSGSARVRVLFFFFFFLSKSVREKRRGAVRHDIFTIPSQR